MEGVICRERYTHVHAHLSSGNQDHEELASLITDALAANTKMTEGGDKSAAITKMSESGDKSTASATVIKTAEGGKKDGSTFSTAEGVTKDGSTLNTAEKDDKSMAIDASAAPSNLFGGEEDVLNLANGDYKSSSSDVSVRVRASE